MQPVQTKCCTKCKTVKPLTEFPTDRSCQDGTRAQCKACRSAGRRVWERAWRDKNRDTQNPERKRAHDAAYYAKNKEKKIAMALAWKKANSGKVKEYKRKATKQIPKHYAVHLLTASGFPASEITDDLVEVKRIHLNIKRSLKHEEHHKSA